jgi:hypothetical protein
MNAKNYRHMRPGLQRQDWGMTEVWVADPFGNHIRFGERIEAAAA